MILVMNGYKQDKLIRMVISIMAQQKVAGTMTLMSTRY